MRLAAPMHDDDFYFFGEHVLYSVYPRCRSGQMLRVTGTNCQISKYSTPSPKMAIELDWATELLLGGSSSD